MNLRRALRAAGGRARRPMERLASAPPRWNGWAADVDAPSLTDEARATLAEHIGPGTAPVDATLDDVAARLPAGRLPAHPAVSADPRERVLHARGQSFADWVALRSGRIGWVPDGVATPTDGATVRDLLAYAAAAGARIVPYGGGTNVVGAVTPRADGGAEDGDGGTPTLTIDLRGLSGLQRLGASSGLATFGAGTTGPAIEAALRERGWTLGHHPQSFERSTLGGWVATRSAGHLSLGYGRIEDLFAGGTLEAPAGTVELPPHPAAAAGPDLRQLVLGSEGRLGILTDVTVRATPLPQSDEMTGIFLPTWEAALTLARDLAQARVPLSMVRALSPGETELTLVLAGRSRGLATVRRYLDLRGVGAGRSLLLVGYAGRRRIVDSARREVSDLARSRRGVGVGAGLANAWRRERYRSAGLRDSLWSAGYGVDTIETAIDWPRFPTLQAAVETAARDSIATASPGERALAFSHAGHLYPTGASLYTTVVFRLAADPDETLARWSAAKDAASRAIVAHGATISHQHGVGRDHAPHLAAEKSALGMAALADVARRFDPDGVMNPGALLGDADRASSER